MSYLSVFPHGPLEEVFEEIFFVRGSIKMGAWGVLNRNMVVVRRNKQLTLINAVRLDDEGEKKLKSLGTVAHVMKIGAYHGADDPYYVDTYGATLWALAGHEHRGGLKTEKELGPGKELPFPRAQLFQFELAKVPEAIVILEQAGGIMVSCDACQNWVDNEFAGFRTKIWSLVMGFKKPANIGPGFLMFAQNKKKEGPTLKADFDRLLELEFKHLLPAHGAVLRDRAKELLSDTVKRVYG